MTVFGGETPGQSRLADGVAPELCAFDHGRRFKPPIDDRVFVRFEFPFWTGEINDGSGEARDGGDRFALPGGKPLRKHREQPV
jgi:hypothetical protein